VKRAQVVPANRVPGGARIEIRTDVEKRLKVAAITGFTAGEMEGNWQATEVGLQVNLGREKPPRERPSA
jgi:hypothetical protein